MSRAAITIRGRSYLTLEMIAECYVVEVEWVREAFHLGLLGRGETVGESTAVAAAALDRVGRILRLHRQHGVNLVGIATLLALSAESCGDELDELW